jgi:putative PEP-CTERM system TPR-repeat lipoprotein
VVSHANRALTFVLVIAACVMTGACTEQSPPELLVSAKGYIAQGKWQAAVIQLKNALQKDPQLGEARFLLGQALLEEERPRDAAVELSKAAGLGYPADQVAPLRARALLLEGDIEKLTREYAGTALHDPVATADLKSSLAVAFAVQNRPQDADAALDAALQAAPDFAAAQLLLSRRLAAKGDVEGALALTSRILAKSPTDRSALEYRGDLLLYGKHDLDGAMDAYGRAVALRKDSVNAYSGMIAVYLERGDLAAARKALASLKAAKAQHPQTMYLDAVIALHDGDLPRARDASQRLLAAAPDNPRLLQLAGRVAERMGSFSQAEQHLTKALQIDPGSATTRRLLTQVYLRTGQQAKALETLQPLVGSESDLQTLALAGAAELKRGDWGKAEAFYSEASRLNPGDPRIGTALAVSRFTQGKTEAAVDQLEAISLSANDVVPDLALIQIRLRQGNIPGALEIVDRVEKKQPNKPFAPAYRGRLMLLAGDVQAARRSFEQALERDPLYLPAVESLSDLDMRDKKPAEAARRFEKVLKAQPNQARALIGLARVRDRAGSPPEDVAKLLVTAVDSNTGDADARIALVSFWLAKNNTQRGLTAAQAAATALPADERIIATLARAQLATGDFNQAISSFGKVVSMRPGAVQPLMDLADAYAASKDDGKAIETLRKVLTTSPRDWGAQQRLIKLYVKTGNFSEALSMARVLQKQSGSAGVGYGLEGDVQAARKNWPEAAASYRVALEKDPSTKMAERLHASFMAAGDRASAEALRVRWLKAHPDDSHFFFYLGKAAIEAGDYDKGALHFSKAVELQPDNPAAHNNLAWTLEQLNRGKEALEHARRANELAPDQPGVMDTLAMALAKEGSLTEALAMEKRAVSLDGKNPALRLSLAKLYARAGETTLARRELDFVLQAGEPFAASREVRELAAKL